MTGGQRNLLIQVLSDEIRSLDELITEDHVVIDDTYRAELGDIILRQLEYERDNELPEPNQLIIQFDDDGIVNTVTNTVSEQLIFDFNRILFDTMDFINR